MIKILLLAMGQSTLGRKVIDVVGVVIGIVIIATIILIGGIEILTRAIPLHLEQGHE